MEGRLGDDPAMSERLAKSERLAESERLASIAFGWQTLSLAVLAALVFNTPVFAGDYYGPRPLR
jgi:hypothetical protein